LDFGLFIGKEIWRGKKWCRILQIGQDNLPRSFIITPANAYVSSKR